ncbi:MAG TPA: class I SAM-dependent methyltransferase, partial [Nitrosopumilaceae archaeon]|nr:class I SAM-dependent methyltransferase [Nitrosopumilaceae archaeon]
NEEQSKQYRPEIPGDGSETILPYYQNIATDLPLGARIVEVGVLHGRSALFMAEMLADARKAATFYCVDILPCPGVIGERQRFIREACLLQTIEFIQRPSFEAPNQFDDDSLDFVFLDAHSTYEGLLDDIRAWLPKVKGGGILAGNNYREEFPEIIKAVNTVFADKTKFPSSAIWEYRKPATKNLKYTIAIGIGDSIITRIFFDTIKHEYDQIGISYSENVIRAYRDDNYRRFLQELGNLLFNSPPYHFDHTEHPYMDNGGQVFKDLNIVPRKSDLQAELCKGEPLDSSEDYIVITTKSRAASRDVFTTGEARLWETLKRLSTKYKVVIMGERNIEISKEYHEMLHHIYCIYDKIIANIPADRIIDLSVPALGVSV